MIQRIFYITMLLATWQATFSQSKHGVAWVNGASIASRVTRFNPNNALTQYTIGPVPSSKAFQWGHSNICDTSGKLILVSDGFNLYDSSLTLIDGGGLCYPLLYQFYNGTVNPFDQGSIILPFGDGIYYMINLGLTNECFDSSFTLNKFPPDRLLYHKIDMKMNNGAGKVYEKMVVLDSGRFEASGMMACRHSNGKDWWLIKQGADSVRFYTYLITKDSVVRKGIQHFPNIVFETSSPDQFFLYSQGQIMFNNSGTKMASVTQQRKSLYTYDFDRCTGLISHAQQFIQPGGGIDSNMKVVCFSPNDRFIYVAQSGRILQFDTQAPDSATAWYVVAGMDTIGTQFQGYKNIYPGPDYKLYIGNLDGFSSTMSVINQPNVKGVGCAWCPKCLRFDSISPPPYSGISQPPCMPNYSLGALSIPCPPLSTNSVGTKMSEFRVYPNPVSTILEVKYTAFDTKLKPLEVFNALGQLVLKSSVKSQTTKLDVGHLPKGVYLLKIEHQTVRFVKE